MARRTAIAWRNLVHDRPRTATALAGVGFSLIVIFLQLGFLQATLRTATIVIEKLDYDIVIVSKNYHYLADAGTFPMARLRQAEVVPGVVRAVPLYVRSGLWRSKAPLVTRGDPRWLSLRYFALRKSTTAEPWTVRSILVLGYLAGDHPFQSFPGFRLDEIEDQLDDLARPDTLLIDRRSRWEFGPKEPDTPVELNQKEFKVVGNFAIGTGFAADGAVLLNHHNFARAMGGPALDLPSLGLVKLGPGARTEDVVRRLRKALPTADTVALGAGSIEQPGADVRVLSRAAIERQERWYWISEKSIGILFVMGVVISFLVGLVVVYQVLSSDVADHLPEFATLKAIGHTDWRIAAIVIEQAVILGLVGYAAALAVSVGLYWVVESSTNLPMTLRVWWVLAVPLFLAIVMTSGSALLSVGKLRAADPADLFR